jgi:hypothetical protein
MSFGALFIGENEERDPRTREWGRGSPSWYIKSIYSDSVGWRTLPRCFWGASVEQKSADTIRYRDKGLWRSWRVNKQTFWTPLYLDLCRWMLLDCNVNFLNSSIQKFINIYLKEKNSFKIVIQYSCVIEVHFRSGIMRARTLLANVTDEERKCNSASRTTSRKHIKASWERNMVPVFACDRLFFSLIQRLEGSTLDGKLPESLSSDH